MMPDDCFIDTNVLLRLALNDEPDQSPRAEAFFGRTARGEIIAWISDTVIFEAVYVLEKNNRVERENIAETVLDILSAPGIKYLGWADMNDVFALYTRHRHLSIADCLHASLARQLPATTIVSFDEGFDRIDGLRRVEPPELPSDQ